MKVRTAATALVPVPAAIYVMEWDELFWPYLTIAGSAVGASLLVWAYEQIRMKLWFRSFHQTHHSTPEPVQIPVIQTVEIPTVQTPAEPPPPPRDPVEVADEKYRRRLEQIAKLSADEEYKATRRELARAEYEEEIDRYL